MNIRPLPWKDLTEEQKLPFLEISREVLQDLLWCRRSQTLEGPLSTNCIVVANDTRYLHEVAKKIYNFTVRRLAQCEQDLLDVQTECAVSQLALLSCQKDLDSRK